MYLDFFNLRTFPFQVEPDADFLYLSRAHARAKAYLDYAVWSPDGFVVITGEVGSGKTILIKKLLSQLSDNVVTAAIFQTQIDEIELLQLMLVEFGFKPFNAKKIELLDMLNTFLFEQYSHKRQVVLLVDEAQNLSDRALEEIRLLSGLEKENERVLNVILVGQSELAAKLDSPNMEQLAQRVKLKFHLKELSHTEIKDYIEHRLIVAGARNSRLFPPDTIPLIHRYTGGVPRLINILCDISLTAAFVENMQQTSPDIVNMAIGELQWVPYLERTCRPQKNTDSLPSSSDHPLTLRPEGALLDHKAIEEKLNRLYDFVPKFATNITTKMKQFEEQLNRIKQTLKHRR